MRRPGLLGLGPALPASRAARTGVCWLSTPCPVCDTSVTAADGPRRAQTDLGEMEGPSMCLGLSDSRCGWGEGGVPKYQAYIEQIKIDE